MFVGQSNKEYAMNYEEMTPDQLAHLIGDLDHQRLALKVKAKLVKEALIKVLAKQELDSLAKANELKMNRLRAVAGVAIANTETAQSE
jgi:hypothetical protein